MLANHGMLIEDIFERATEASVESRNVVRSTRQYDSASVDHRSMGNDTVSARETMLQPQSQIASSPSHAAGMLERPTNDIKCNNVGNESPPLNSYFACVTEEHPSSPRQELDELPALVDNAGHHYDKTVTPVTTFHDTAPQMHSDPPSSGALILPGSSKPSKDQAGDRLGHISEEVNTPPFQFLQRARVARDKEDSQPSQGSNLSLINSAGRIEQQMNQSTTDHSPYPGGNYTPRTNADPEAAAYTRAVDGVVMPGVVLRFKAGPNPAGRGYIINNSVDIGIAASGRSVEPEADASGTRNKPKGESSLIDRAHDTGDSCNVIGHDVKKEKSRTLQRTGENVIIPDSGLERTALERTGSIKHASESTINAEEEMATVNKPRPLRGNEMTSKPYGSELSSSRDDSEIIPVPWQEVRSVVTRAGITAVVGVLANKIVDADGTSYVKAYNEVYLALSGAEEQVRETTATSCLAGPQNVELAASRVRFRSNGRKTIPKPFLVL